MSDATAWVLAGVKGRDWLLMLGLSALAVALMTQDALISDTEVAAEVAAGSMFHPVSSHSWWMLPVFLLAVVPVLWWRRGVLAVAGAALAVMVVHVAVFGWVTRCGAGLPLALTLAYLAGVAHERRRAVLGLTLAALLTCAVLALDATTGFAPVVLFLPTLFIVFLVGRAVRRRELMSRELRRRNDKLRLLRDRRAALQVAADRARLARELDGLLQVRLAELARLAQSAEQLDPARSRSALQAIETGSRQTLQDMREIMGLLREGRLDLTPRPSHGPADQVSVS